MDSLKDLKKQYDKLGLEIKKLEEKNWMKIKLPIIPNYFSILFSNKEMNWEEANNWCKEQKGRLPTKFELQAFAESNNIPEDRKDTWYWSASAVSYNSSGAWSVNLSNGYAKYTTRIHPGNSVLCLRK